MKSFRLLCTLIIILFVFVGNIGINVFTHSCEEDGTINSFIVKAEDHCSEKEQVSCCSEEEEIGDCCKDEVTTFKVKFDYFDSDDLHLPFWEFTASKHPVIAYLQGEQQTKFLTLVPRPPPKIVSGQHLLILHQVFRI